MLAGSRVCDVFELAAAAGVDEGAVVVGVVICSAAAAMSQRDKWISSIPTDRAGPIPGPKNRDTYKFHTIVPDIMDLLYHTSNLIYCAPRLPITAH